MYDTSDDEVSFHTGVFNTCLGARYVRTRYLLVFNTIIDSGASTHPLVLVSFNSSFLTSIRFSL